MNRNVLIAAAVAVVALVAVAAVLMAGGGNDSPSAPDTPAGDESYRGTPAQTDTSAFFGLVYGNADGDADIDSDDVALINDIIEGRKSLSDYPLADANGDGRVTEADRTVVENVVAGRYTLQNPTTLIVKDGMDNISQVRYPVDGVFASGGTNMRVLIQVLGIEDQLKANATNDYIGEMLDNKLYTLRENGTVKKVTTNATTGDWTELSMTRFSLALIEDSGMSGYFSGNAMKYWSDFDISALVFVVDDYGKLRQSLATVGILTGTEANAAEYIVFMDGIVDKIKTTLGDRFGTATVMDIVMSNSVSGTEADYFKATEMAGGNNLADWPETTRAFDPKQDQWLFDEKYNPQFLIHFKSMVYGKEPSSTDINNYKSYFDKTKAFMDGNYYLINGTVPLPVRLALMATIMYQDAFDADWAYDVFQEYFDRYSGYNDGKAPGDADYWDVRNYKILWSTEDLSNISA